MGIFQQKTRMIDVQLSINNTPFRIYNNERTWSMKKEFAVKYGDNKSSKMKLYIFNDLLLCASLSDKHGIAEYLASFSFYCLDLKVVPTNIENIACFDIYLESNDRCKLTILFKSESQREKITKKLQKKISRMSRKSKRGKSGEGNQYHIL